MFMEEFGTILLPQTWPPSFTALQSSHRFTLKDPPAKYSWLRGLENARGLSYMALGASLSLGRVLGKFLRFPCSHQLLLLLI